MLAYASYEDWWDTIGQVPLELQRAAPNRHRSLALRSSNSKSQCTLSQIPPHSRKPGGSRRRGQRTGDRFIPQAEQPVDLAMIDWVLNRPWRVGGYEPSIWRTRGLAVLAIATCVPRSTTTLELAAMLPAQVRELPLSRIGRRWVETWLTTRRRVLGASADQEPWATFPGSRGRPRMLSWLATRTLDRAGAPGWRLSQLLRAPTRLAEFPPTKSHTQLGLAMSNESVHVHRNRRDFTRLPATP